MRCGERNLSIRSTPIAHWPRSQLAKSNRTCTSLLGSCRASSLHSARDTASSCLRDIQSPSDATLSRPEYRATRLLLPVSATVGRAHAGPWLARRGDSTDRTSTRHHHQRAPLATPALPPWTPRAHLLRPRWRLLELCLQSRKASNPPSRRAQSLRPH